MTDREQQLLDALIKITDYYSAYRSAQAGGPSAAIKRARAVIRQFEREASQ